MLAPTQYLIVVQRSEPDLYERLRRRFHDLDFVDVLLDRRQLERRRCRGSVRTERRRGDRRQPLTSQERERWIALGYLLVRQGETLDLAGVSDSA
jgi:hypothetical protein